MSYTGYVLVAQPDTALQRFRRGIAFRVSRGVRRVVRTIRAVPRGSPPPGKFWGRGPDLGFEGSGRPAPVAPAPPSLLTSAAADVPVEPMADLDLRPDRRRPGLR